jgi:hypothetical protein
MVVGGPTSSPCREVMAYSATRELAVAAVRALALRVAADCIDQGEEVPDQLARVVPG